MKKKRQGIIFLLILFINVSFVLAQSTLEPMFRLLSDFGLLGSIETYPYVWDAILFITLFIALGRLIFAKRFSPQAGGVIGFCLGVIMISGEVALKFSVVRDLGPWFLIGGVIALIVFLVRIMFKEEGDNRTGAMAFGIFIILTLILNGLPQTGTFLSNNAPLLFSLLMAAQVIALIFSIIWFIKIIGAMTGKGSPGDFGRRLGSLGDSIKSLKDGGKKLRDSIFSRPTTADINNLTQRVHTFQGEVARFTTQLQNLISFIGYPGANRSMRGANLPPNQQQGFNMQINNQLSHILPVQARLVTEAASILADRAYGSMEATDQAGFAAANNQLINIQGNLALALT